MISPDIRLGDCRDVMVAMQANSIDTIVTDPPYGLSFMGKGWDHAVPGADYWRAALRVAKPGAMLLAFGGTRTFHRLAAAIEDAGWELRDCLSWLYGTGFPKSLDIAKAIDRAAGAAREVVGSKLGLPGYHLSPDDTPAANLGDGLSTRTREQREAAATITAPATDAAKRWHGWGTALKPAWEPIILAMKPTDGTFAENAGRHGVAGLAIDAGRIGSAARFPANLLLDEEAAATLDAQSGFLHGAGNLGGTPKTAEGYNGSWPAKEMPAALDNGGGASRFFYCAKASRRERGEGNDHPTVKPLALMRYLCRLTKTPTGGVVLDPFAGSGSTLLAAMLEGRPSIGIEMDSHNAEICVSRAAEIVNA